MREDARIAAKKLRERFGGDSAGEDGESEVEEDWNTIEGTHITADGDIMPNFNRSRSYKKVKKGQSSTGDESAPLAGPVEPGKSDEDPS